MVECIVRVLKTPESEVPAGSKYYQSVTARLNDNMIYVAQIEMNILDSDNFTADIFPAVSKIGFSAVKAIAFPLLNLCNAISFLSAECNSFPSDECNINQSLLHWQMAHINVKLLRTGDLIFSCRKNRVGEFVLSLKIKVKGERGSESNETLSHRSMKMSFFLDAPLHTIILSLLKVNYNCYPTTFADD